MPIQVLNQSKVEYEPGACHDTPGTISCPGCSNTLPDSCLWSGKTVENVKALGP